jgi:hypothetical protein
MPFLPLRLRLNGAARASNRTQQRYAVFSCWALALVTSKERPVAGPRGPSPRHNADPEELPGTDAPDGRSGQGCSPL